MRKAPRRSRSSEKARIDNIRKLASATALGTSIATAILFTKLLTMVDFAEPVHIMLLLSTAIVVATVAFGLIALGNYCRAWILEAGDRRRR